MNNPNFLKFDQSEIETIYNKIDLTKKKGIYLKNKIIYKEKNLARDLILILKDNIKS